MASSSEKHDNVKDYYGKVLSDGSGGLKTNACSARSAPHPTVCAIIRTKVPSAVNERFYGCGNPIPLGIGGMDVLDLGSGCGRDSYVAAALAGPEGSVTGVDMTDELLEVARANVAPFAETLGYRPRLRFLAGYIENLQAAGVEPESADLCISNCVVNLSPNKRAVLQGVFAALRPGGEFHFADMYADRVVPPELAENKVLHGEGLAGALCVPDFERLARAAGFAQPRVLDAKRIDVLDPALRELVGDTQYFSVTYRLFKPDGSKTIRTADTASAVAVYRGTVDGCEEKYVLDMHSSFEAGVPAPVDADTAAVLESSWLAKHFVVETLEAAINDKPDAAPTLAMLQSL
ncbi:hypothetical protein GGI11_004851 [Coemansia sp. RSA 2049]|nr:hypothetical protein H4217_007117 [Coemansia sp. RSA 1939]KAJ2512122.1 hypothetical protein GGI11_004851 [Coemansia sp. RSA 2049]KAJ2605006.1 hypothetical protein EV177_006252 [Coemansia sp. RSA 1804]KAJ2684176.1 hypothetical protein GGH99_004129 [Coemansia sp. RSA 1285]